MRFADPLALVLLLLLPLILYLRLRSRGPALIFSSLSLVPAQAGWRCRLHRLPLFLRLAALALLIIALARPQSGMENIREVNNGVAMEMVLDRSGSMGREMDFDGRKMTRLSVVKKVFSEFVNGGGSLPGRPNDLIGMITFARYADTICPLTLARGPLRDFLDSIKVVPPRSPENRTAIGDAIALAAARLHVAEKTMARETGTAAKNYKIKSKIIILMTDGANNAGRYTPEAAAALAKKWGIKIYAIGVGGNDVVKVQTIFGTQMIRTGNGVDRKLLAAIAAKTGGIFKMAGNGKALQDVYKQIDKLEKSKVESIRFLNYKEHFFYFALSALLLLLLETALRCTVFRRIP
ncbi:Aerotolerance protein BatA [hydrothermal vent metagenome]|uniref:Aerotolerance protein BatA n=1 Tax=hydrothermal vent metagenome TaxID=652676 RepID=A0A3B0VLV7_9ZZZZ